MPQFSGWLEPYLPLIILGFCLLLVFRAGGRDGDLVHARPKSISCSPRRFTAASC